MGWGGVGWVGWGGVCFGVLRAEERAGFRSLTLTLTC
jgi:hypothetical protein